MKLFSKISLQKSCSLGLKSHELVTEHALQYFGNYEIDLGAAFLVSNKTYLCCTYTFAALLQAFWGI